jgi:hypothetical protein
MQLTMASLGACQAPGFTAEARRGLQQQRAAARPRAAVVVRASSLDSKGLFTTNSSLLGPKPNLSGPSTSLSGPGPASSSKPQTTVDDVELASGVSARRPQTCPASLAAAVALLASQTKLAYTSLMDYGTLCIMQRLPSSTWPPASLHLHMPPACLPTSRPALWARPAPPLSRFPPIPSYHAG